MIGYNWDRLCLVTYSSVSHIGHALLSPELVGQCAPTSLCEFGPLVDAFRSFSNQISVSQMAVQFPASFDPVLLVISVRADLTFCLFLFLFPSTGKSEKSLLFEFWKLFLCTLYLQTRRWDISNCFDWIRVCGSVRSSVVNDREPCCDHPSIVTARDPKTTFQPEEFPFPLKTFTT